MWLATPNNAPNGKELSNNKIFSVTARKCLLKMGYNPICTYLFQDRNVGIANVKKPFPIFDNSFPYV